MRDASGRIIRPDWNQPPLTVHAQHDVPAKLRPDWGKPRDESGRYITKSDAELRQQWEREGGNEANVAKVMATEQAILGLSDNPQALQVHVASLPVDFSVRQRTIFA